MNLPNLIIRRLCALLIIFTCLSAFFLSGCKQKHLDEKRDLTVNAYDKVKKVLRKELHQTDDQLLMNQKLTMLGVNDDNRVRLQRALKEEFGISLPFSHLGEEETVGTIVRYMASYNKNAFAIKENRKQQNYPVPGNFGNLDPKNKKAAEKKEQETKIESVKTTEKSPKTSSLKTEKLDFSAIDKIEVNQSKRQKSSEFGKLKE